ncbi:MAG: metallophosphoesterase [Clostridia bacterium]|nr:metallophosphoesterase [Clostridia bacterium]
MKKIISILLAVSLLFSFCIFANAETDKELKFGEDGKFTVLQISDPQDDHYPAYDMVNFIKLAIEETSPDLIVFTGDIVEDSRVADPGVDGEGTREGVEVEGDYEQTLKNVTAACEAVFAEAESKGIPFAVCQGNNDYNSGVTNEDWLKLYSSYKNSLTVDESNDESGRIDFNLEIKGSDGKTAFNIWMMDTAGSSVTAEQLDWYKSESAALRAENGGEPVPAILFQHVPTSDPGFLFEECNIWDEGARLVDGKLLRLNKEVANGYNASAFTIPEDTSEQFKAWKECGDVLGAYFGHWHTEGFTGTYDGIELGMTYGCEFAKTGPYGIRVFTLNENDIKNFDNELYTYEGSVKSGNARFELQTDEPYAVYDNAIEAFFAGIGNIFNVFALIVKSWFA